MATERMQDQAPARYWRAGSVGVVAIDNPPVNAVSPAVVEALAKALDSFDADADAQALVLYGEGRGFVAGGDIAAFEDPAFSAAPFNAVLQRLEAMERPVVASLHGTVLGGGLELAMACHHRVAHPRTRLGLPEVRLGLLPGSMGTQRLPRLVGMPRALDLIRTGRQVSAEEALTMGLIDRIDDGRPLALGEAAAMALIAQGRPPRRTGRLEVPPFDAALLQQAHAAAAAQPGRPNQAAIVRCIEAAARCPFDEGARIEAAEFHALVRSPESAALRHLFFAERQALKVPGLCAATPTRPIRRVGVLGAGTMGTGIAMSLLNAGLPTVLVDVDRAALDRGLDTLRTLYRASVEKGRLSAQDFERRWALLDDRLELAAFADCDLVIEAVYEDLALKQRVCAQLGQVLRPGAMLATNTSTLDVDRLAEASGRAGDFLGLHFFSPAHVMRLLEVVRGRRTAPDVLATALQLGARLGKQPVVSGVCYGFIGNRMAEVYMREAEQLILEGASPQQVDAAVQALGFAMGPCRMLDMAGVDVGARTVIERAKAGGLPPDPAYRALVQRLHALGRHGQKSGAGYYRYEGRVARPDPAVTDIARELAALHGIERRAVIPDQEIVERLLYPLINEGLRILEERIALRPGDIDVVWVAGYGFPDHRGGPMWMADRIGLPQVAQTMQRHARRTGDPYGYWRRAALLDELVARGASLSAWRAPAD
jgi:3-hydroxyacyl-CoA dehydrogenase